MVATELHGPGELVTPKPSKSIWLLFCLALLVMAAYGPTYNAKYELNDDHFHLNMAQVPALHHQLPKYDSAFTTMRIEIQERGRMAPAGMLVYYLNSKFLVDNPVIHRIFMLCMAIATALLLYQCGVNFTNSAFGGFIFSLWLMLAPVSSDLWPHIVRGETTGMLLFALVLLTLTSPNGGRAFWPWIGLAAFLFLSFVKESFFLLAPAFAWLAYPHRSGSHETAYRQDKRLAYGYLLVGLFAGISIFLAAIYAGSESHGGSSMNLSIADAVSRLLSRDGILWILAVNSLWSVPLILIVLQAFWNRQWPPEIPRRTLAFCLLLVLPQIAIYLTRSYFAGRYSYPMLVGVVLLNVLALLGLLRAPEKPILKRILFVLLAVIFARFLQIQVFESMNLTARTNAIQRLASEVANSVPERGTIIIIGPPKTEHAAALLTFLGHQGKPNTRVYLHQPNGSDGHTDYGFDGRESIGKVDPESVDAVIFLPDLDGFGDSQLPWPKPMHLVDHSINYQSLFLSLRKMALVRVPGRFVYAVRET